MRNDKGVTHTGRWRAQYDADELAVLALTGMSLGELVDLKTDTGKRWLMIYAMNNCGYTASDAEEMWKEPILLQWWNTEWRRMDHFVLLKVLHLIPPNERATFYRDTHLEVYMESHPNYKLMELTLKHISESIKTKAA